jgi:hypothetical protein
MPMSHIASLIDQYLAFWPSGHPSSVQTSCAISWARVASSSLAGAAAAYRKIRLEIPLTRQMWSEFAHSMSTVAVFASVGTDIALGKLHRVLPIYTDVAEYGRPYFFASLILMIVAHDALLGVPPDAPLALAVAPACYSSSPPQS